MRKIVQTGYREVYLILIIKRMRFLGRKKKMDYKLWWFDYKWKWIKLSVSPRDLIKSLDCFIISNFYEKIQLNRYSWRGGHDGKIPLSLWAAGNVLSGSNIRKLNCYWCDKRKDIAWWGLIFEIWNYHGVKLLLKSLEGWRRKKFSGL